MSLKLDVVSRDINNLDKKVDSGFDRLIFLVVGGVVMKAGFDLYINKRNWNRVREKK